MPEIPPGILDGYLDPKALPNNRALLPQPPAECSAALALDEAGWFAFIRLYGPEKPYYEKT